MAKKDEGSVAIQTEATPVLPATLGQKDIPTMLEMVNKQIATIKGNLPETPVTTAVLPGFDKIEDIKTVEELIKAASSVIGKSDAYAKAAEVVYPGKKAPKFKIEGFTREQWLDHITSRLIMVANKAELDKLIATKKLLEENLSAEAKLANDLAKIRDMLTSEE